MGAAMNLRIGSHHLLRGNYGEDEGKGYEPAFAGSWGDAESQALGAEPKPWIIHTTSLNREGERRHNIL